MYESLKEIIQALYTNTTTLPKKLAYGKNGHVGPIMKDTLYAPLSTVTPWEDPDDPDSRPPIVTNVTVTYRQNANETCDKVLQTSENAATMEEAPKNQIIETIEDTYIEELCNKYKGFTGVKTIDLVHHLMDIYGKITETDLNNNQKKFDEALETAMPIGKYFEQIDDCIQYSDDGKQPYTAAQIIKNDYTTVLNMGLYT